MNVGQFDLYLNREVEVEEGSHKLTFMNKDMEVPTHNVKDTDEVLKELCGKIKDAGFSARVWLPSSMGTMDYKLSRVNIYIAKDEIDGKYKITKIYVG